MLDMPLQQIGIIIPCFILGLCVHEYAHARVALYFGDYTAKAEGRVTLNPLKHIDPIGLITLLLVGFGWAKPVPVNTLNMRNPRLGDIMVSLAGPASNLIIGIVAGLALRTLLAFETYEPEYTIYDKVLIYFSTINIAFFLFNLLPIYPLDGHHILREFLPASHRIQYQYWQTKYGQWILLFLVFSPRLLRLPDSTKLASPIKLLFDASDKVITFVAGINLCG